MTEAEKVINMVDDFSLPFCQLKLQILFAVESRTDVTNDIVDVMFKAAVADSGAKRSHWADLVALMSEDAVRQVRILSTSDACSNRSRSENEPRTSFFRFHS